MLCFQCDLRRNSNAIAMRYFVQHKNVSFLYTLMGHTLGLFCKSNTSVVNRTSLIDRKYKHDSLGSWHEHLLLYFTSTSCYLLRLVHCILYYFVAYFLFYSFSSSTIIIFLLLPFVDVAFMLLLLLLLIMPPVHNSVSVVSVHAFTEDYTIVKTVTSQEDT